MQRLIKQCELLQLTSKQYLCQLKDLRKRGEDMEATDTVDQRNIVKLEKEARQCKKSLSRIRADAYSSMTGRPMSGRPDPSSKYKPISNTTRLLSGKIRTTSRVGAGIKSRTKLTARPVFVP